METLVGGLQGTSLLDFMAANSTLVEHYCSTLTSVKTAMYYLAQYDSLRGQAGTS